MMDDERRVRERLAKSIVAKADIPAGTVITSDMLTVKGPGSGLKPGMIPLLVGVVAEAPIAADTLVPVEAIKWRRS
jgi:N-acetylneuraminate synthase/N,N'-diacetyllegionaminate synthase